MADAVAAPDDEDAAIGKELKRRRRLAAANRRAKESSTDESDASVASEEEEGEKAAKDGEKEEEVGAAASPAKATSVSEAVASVDGLEATEEQAGEFVKTADGWEWKGDGSEPSEKVQRSNGGIWGRLCGWGLCGRGSRLEEEDDD